MNTAQSPKPPIPEKAKYPEATRQFMVKDSQKKYLRRGEVLLVARSSTKNIAAATKFTIVPPAVTRRVSALHSMLTVETINGLPPVKRQAPPCPTASCKTFVSICATMPTAAIVSASD